MTIKDLLIRKNISFNEVRVDEFTGITDNGTKWYMRRAGGAYGFQMTLSIGDKFISHCKLQTAIKKIKTM